MVDPGASGEKILVAMTRVNVFFTSEKISTLLMGITLLRFVRQPNYVGVWAVVEVLEW
jgi:hypothetical protein